MKISFILAIFLLFSHSYSGKRIAVNKISPEGIGENGAVMLTDALRSELMKTGKFDIMERTDMTEISDEQALAHKGAIDDTANAPESGKLLPAEYQVIGRVFKENYRYTLNIRLVNSETGKIEKDETMRHRGSFEGLLEKAVPVIAQKIAGTYVKPKKSQKAVWITAGVITAAAVPALWYFTQAEDEAPPKESFNLEVEW